MKTQQPSGFGRKIQWPLRRGPALIAIALALGACGTPSGTSEEPRYPEKRRPPPLRSASDGEVMGASGQSPEDTLEGSPTNLHPARGWEGEKGATERAKEAADCDPEAPKAKNASDEPSATAANASASQPRPRSNRPCPKPAR
jgi:hypothetical protein